ncbi:MAG: ErfK/YbiS/YcfS/YnhG family protein [Solirubrobacterales bacterium]|nr:ErfK/YbiS/YcfS/YnhG family protein [Solirubrobacterales bacterium]
MKRGSIAALLMLAVVVAVVAFGAHDRSAGAPLGSHVAGEAAPAAPLPATRLASLPKRVIANGTDPLTVTLSAPVSPTSPPPTLSPKPAGTWRVVGDSEVFTPVSTLQPCSSYALTVWARTGSTGHAELGRRQTIGLRVACPPLAGLQQALARLGYLAAKLHPRYIVHIRAGVETRREAAEHAFDPPRGALAADPADAPPVQMGQLDATTRGALEVYQADRGLQVTGVADSPTWASVLYDETNDRRDRQPYTWVSVSESLPETLAVHRGRRVAFTTPVNTGVPGAETAQGIFPIYSRYVSTTMSGTDVDGTKYVVPDVPWVNYFNGGDAVHGYPRASYGFPQSNGCVELPIEAAHTVFGMLAIGDIVVVHG